RGGDPQAPGRDSAETRGGRRVLAACHFVTLLLVSVAGLKDLPTLGARAYLLPRPFPTAGGPECVPARPPRWQGQLHMLGHRPDQPAQGGLTDSASEPG